MLQGRSGEVTCEAEGPSVSTLKWEKQQDDQSYAAVPKSQVNITKNTKYVRATLKITNAHFADTGTYKCTVSVSPNQSDYKVTAIKVNGRFIAFVFVFCLRFSGSLLSSPKKLLNNHLFLHDLGVEFVVADPRWGPEGWQNSKSIWDRFRTF